ncbi:PREDICTED: uncharacterized protein LOC109232063 isoform X2 [Nicotiana attenuata]|uniref:uncharacterized protein LOC109232063 isoform X2 n=1 Tax=Nicotiana attenuata TaxID=49451 RepID=UPI000904B4B7|nr:PREDICTED: uncharacterized protein LOC109232063 isoform X2 [Nicotiana attenuata]
MQFVDRKKNRLSANSRVTLASIESLSVPLEIVFLADYRCTKCQQRVAEVMSRMNGETESVLISVLEKKVTLTCNFSKGRVASICGNPFNRFTFLMRMFLSSCC